MLHLFYFRGATRFQFSDIHLACIKTAHERGGFKKIVLHEDTPGESSFYKEARTLPYVEFRRTEFPTQINGHPVKDQRLSVDYVRLQTLILEGGVAADMDFIFLQSFAPLLEHDAFIGTQCKQKKKLSCAIMYSKEPQNPFYIAYLGAYKEWEPIHEKKFWTYANNVPYDLSQKYPITVLPVKAFYPVAWSNKTFLQGADTKLSDSYAIHLWGHLKPHLTLEDLRGTALKDYIPASTYGFVAKREGTTISFE